MVDISVIKRKSAAAEETAKEVTEEVSTEVVVEPREPKIDELGRSYATGRRKESTARVWIKPGKGEIIVNKQSVGAYFKRQVLQMIIGQPFDATNTKNSFDVFCTVWSCAR